MGHYLACPFGAQVLPTRQLLHSSEPPRSEILLLTGPLRGLPPEVYFVILYGWLALNPHENFFHLIWGPRGFPSWSTQMVFIWRVSLRAHLLRGQFEDSRYPRLQFLLLVTLCNYLLRRSCSEIG